MTVEELDPRPGNCNVFHLQKHLFIPESPGNYVLASPSMDILYIGQTKMLHRRFIEHLSNPEKVDMTQDGKAFWFWYRFTAEKDLDLIERTWLNQYGAKHGRYPILNKISAPLR